MLLQIIDRFAALDAGMLKYFTGKACRRGHIAARYVSTGGCVNCVNPAKSRPQIFTNGKLMTVGVLIPLDATEEEVRVLTRLFAGWAAPSIAKIRAGEFK